MRLSSYRSQMTSKCGENKKSGLVHKTPTSNSYTTYLLYSNRWVCSFGCRIKSTDNFRRCPTEKKTLSRTRASFKSNVTNYVSVDSLINVVINLLCKQSLHYPPRLALAILRASVVVCIFEYLVKSLNKL